MAKYIFVTGGVVSGLGKGVAAASIGMLLKKRGYKVGILKLDPYLNYDPGTMSPYQHGEVFVTEDGGETDLDLGHYERFIGINLSKNSSVSSGQIYMDVINAERKGEYLGGTVQIVPHITDAIKNRIHKIEKEMKADIVIVEIGGTVGDIESEPFLEAIRQFSHEVSTDDTVFLHLTLIPYLKFSKESKTKPTQHSVKELQKRGIRPNMLLCRTEKELEDSIYEKISLFCNVDKDKVFEGIDVKSIYEIPINFNKMGLDEKILEILKLKHQKIDITKWEEIAYKYTTARKEVEISIVGKYTALEDAYLSVVESLKHAAIESNVKLKVKWVNAEEVEKNGVEKYLKQTDGILVPGGFGDRGIEGKIMAAKYARENDIPYFGICLGMQVAVIEFARHVCEMKKAHSTEFCRSEYPVIDIMEDQKNISNLGGTMRLGSYECVINPDSKVYEMYDTGRITERHRHRFEFNNEYTKLFEENGLLIAGKNPKTNLVEIVENTDHKWFVGVQFHPEFKSRVDKPHPIFNDFIRNCI